MSVTFKVGENMYKLNDILLEYEFIKICIENNSSCEIIELDASHEEMFKMIYTNNFSYLYDCIKGCLCEEFFIKRDMAAIEEVERLYKELLYFGYNKKMEEEFMHKVCELILSQYMKVFINIDKSCRNCPMCRCNRPSVVNFQLEARCRNCGYISYFYDWIVQFSGIIYIELFSFDAQWKEYISDLAYNYGEWYVRI